MEHFPDLLPWDDRFITGIEEIDDQHKSLVKILNQTADRLPTSSNDAISSALVALKNYAAYHFETEEKIWLEVLEGQDDFTAHYDEHLSFISEVERLEADLLEKPAAEMCIKILSFLVRWLVIHIISDDKRLAYIVLQVRAGIPIAEAKRSAQGAFRQTAPILGDLMMSMYETLSYQTLKLASETKRREEAELQLKDANHELEILATTDQLTGLNNRRHFDEILDRELRRSRRDQTSLAMIMFDIDHFKNLNDRYGHAEGDVALSRIGKLLNQICRRPGDYAFRVGGEEFIVLSAGQTLYQATSFAEKIRADIAQLGIANVGSSVCDTLTVSVGVSIWEAGSNLDAGSLYKLSDQRLYKSKETGRNKVVVFD